MSDHDHEESNQQDNSSNKGTGSSPDNSEPHQDPRRSDGPWQSPQNSSRGYGQAPHGQAYGQNPQGQPNYPQQNGYPGQPRQQGYGQPGYGQPQGQGEPGFFQAMFDLSFRHFVTIKFASVIYVIGLIVIGLGWLFSVIAGFAENAWAGIAFLVLGAIVAFVYIILFRVTLEFYVAMVRTSQNTSILVERDRR
ncbi:DUF4282 domain-containing protein [Rothia uropygialis]|uniref:DUF4282 domain-containing protein n=1 Tax=Kocuria sp. 36 TaxID=1415402 RepID=UPI00101C4B95|nr:DUF4282 domain-containing protein [Kocuria sp. 36]